MAKNAEGKISGVETSLNQKIGNIDSYKPWRTPASPSSSTRQI